MDPYRDDEHPPYEEESLLARDENHQLIRVDKPTEAMYDDLKITVEIDGRETQMPFAVPAKDDQGNVLRDADGRTVPRLTTIMDAAKKLTISIPVLCHQDHLTPIGVCRVCSVRVIKHEKDQKPQAESKLVPACRQPLSMGRPFEKVIPKLEIHTIHSPKDVEKELVRSRIRILTELLLADHHHSEKVTKLPREQNELLKLAATLGMNPERVRFEKRPRDINRVDTSSSLIAIDLNACILCNRCVRGCNEMEDKGAKVIGRTGKGYQTKISFGLDKPMGSQESGCIGCGECMISCPTDALTLKSRPIPPKLELGDTPVTPEELQEHPLFRDIPYKFLHWNAHGVVRRAVPAGKALYTIGEGGNTAFTYDTDPNSGYNFAVERDSHVGGSLQKSKAQGSIIGRLLGHYREVLSVKTGNTDQQPNQKSIGMRSIARGANGLPIRTDSLSGSLMSGGLFQQRNRETDPIMGEMTCLHSYPRPNTVKAVEACVVLVLRRNVLRMLLRSHAARAIIDDTICRHALEVYLRNMPLFALLGEDFQRSTVRFLRDKLKFTRLRPGQVIYRQGDLADALCYVRLGYVKIALHRFNQEQVLDYIGPNGFFGDVELMGNISGDVAAHLPTGFRPGRCIAAYSAVDEVEIVQLPFKDFYDLCTQNPDLQARLVEIAIDQLAKRKDSLEAIIAPDILVEGSIKHGFVKGQSLLVLDLERCTRCDECTRGCSDSHGGVTRLVREGERHGRFLVATSCRSCRNPTCILGCPVDAIHREGVKPIIIESHCIGCGLCSRTCPYGVIHMVNTKKVDEKGVDILDEKRRPVVGLSATACDLCESVEYAKGQPQCVAACPHDAAFRMTDEELRERLTPAQA